MTPSKELSRGMGWSFEKSHRSWRFSHRKHAELWKVLRKLKTLHRVRVWKTEDENRERDDRMIARIEKLSPRASSDSVKNHFPVSWRNISLRTVRRQLFDYVLKSYKHVHKLKLSAKNVGDKIALCRLYSSWLRKSNVAGKVNIFVVLWVLQSYMEASKLALWHQMCVFNSQAGFQDHLWDSVSAHARGAIWFM